MDFLTRFALAGAAVLFAAWAAIVGGRWIARQLAAIRPYLVAFLVFTFVAMNYAQKSGTNEPPRGASVELRVESGECKVENGGVVAIGDTTILHSTFSTLHSFRLEAETTNETYSYAMPVNATRYEKWWRRGAYEDVFRLDLDGLLFPLGTNLCDSLWVYTWGMAGVRLGDASNRVVATGAPMSAVPQTSRFWDAPTTNGSHLLTWENFFLNRDTNTPVSAQLELMPSGDFIARSNLVERLYRRVNPDDWDDDGIPNEEDVDPLAYDGDNFGPRQELPEGANTNHYYWIDLVVDHANARVTFIGDGYSHLPDPDFIARAGETNRVMLLLGKSYTIDCFVPVRVVGREDDEIDVYDADGSVGVVWPVYVDFVPRTRSGGGVGATIWPERAAGGNFSWPDNFCCYSFAVDRTPVFDCDGTCGCGGCSTGDITYEIGGHQMSYGGVDCGCSHEEEPESGGDDPPEAPSGPSVSVLFSDEAIVFEDEYTNSVDDVVQRRSTDSELTCEVYGGTNGGHYAFALYDGGRLVKKSGSNLPRSGTVAPGEAFRIKVKYEAQSASGEAGDISAVGTFTEDGSGTELSSEATLTSVKCLVVSTNFSVEPCPYRHIRGIGETFSCEFEPSVYGTSIQAQNGAVCTASYGNQSDILCPYNSASKIVKIQVTNAIYEPDIRVLVPTGIEARNPRMLSYSVPVNSPGGAGFQMDLHILPATVSFQALEFWERASEATESSTIEGYFTNVAFSAVWYHNTNMLAGVWHKIGDGNYWFTDVASMGDELITPVCSGSLVWHIPIDWRSCNNPAILHSDFKVVDQRFEMSDTGRLTVSKHGHWAAREMSGVTYKSEGME